MLPLTTKSEVLAVAEIVVLPATSKVPPTLVLPVPSSTTNLVPSTTIPFKVEVAKTFRVFERVVALVTPRVPAIPVLPVPSPATVNALVSTAIPLFKLAKPVTSRVFSRVVALATSKVPAIFVLPVPSPATVNALVSTAIPLFKLAKPVTSKVPAIFVLPLVLATVNCPELISKSPAKLKPLVEKSVLAFPIFNTRLLFISKSPLKPKLPPTLKSPANQASPSVFT